MSTNNDLTKDESPLSARIDHYTSGRRWSVINHAWVLDSSWNDKEEIAALREKIKRLENRLWPLNERLNER